jgi:hypothetical protein
MEKKLELTEKDLKEMEKEIESNKKQRRQFLDLYCKWLKKTPNKEWSKQQNELINK